MATMTFVNLPVQDLARSRAFFTGLGLRFNEEFSDDNTACLVVSDLALVMLHREPTFTGFTGQPLVDTSAAREVLLGLSADSREEVDRLAARVEPAGGRLLGEPVDQGFMYMQGFLDPDGHQWSSTWLDLTATGQG